MKRMEPTTEIPKVWAIRMKGWVELRTGPSIPKKQTSQAILSVLRRQAESSVWNPMLNTFVREKSRPARDKFVLVTTTFSGGTPFKWVPFAKYSRTGGQLADGEVRAVPPFLAAVYLGLKPSKRQKEARRT